MIDPDLRKRNTARRPRARRGGDSDSAEPFTIRTVTPSDRAQVERLFHDGLLPGHVNYEQRESEQIRQALDSDRAHFWVAQAAGGRVIGTVAVVEVSPDVGHIHWLRVGPEWQSNDAVAMRLSQAAADHAREVGFLKLLVHAPEDVEKQVASYYHRLGFEFSRSRELDGRHMLEFYLNLYAQPRRRERRQRR